VFQSVQDTHVLEPFRFLAGSFLVALDGTGQFSSSTVCCPDCAIKQTRGGDTLYYHQLLGAAIVHPDREQVLPLIPEPILRDDGDTKNDCEKNAAKRLLTRLREDYPALPMTIIEDALTANGPHIKLLQKLKFSYIIGVKEGDHAHLFEAVKTHEENETMGGLTQQDEQGKITRTFRFVNGLELNKSHPNLKVNFLEYIDIELEGSRTRCRFTWITDIKITESNCAEIMRGGRSRWKIENETFNTPKNQGYRLEHNYGHGNQHLSTNFALLMMLAFLIDQVQELAYVPFQQARRRFRSRTSLWERIRALFVGYFRSWILDASRNLRTPSWRIFFEGTGSRWQSWRRVSRDKVEQGVRCATGRQPQLMVVHPQFPPTYRPIVSLRYTLSLRQNAPPHCVRIGSALCFPDTRCERSSIYS